MPVEVKKMKTRYPKGWNTYQDNYEWNGFQVRQSRAGYIVRFWSRVQGSLDGRKILVRFSEQITPERDLKITWTATTTLGQAIALVAADGGPGVMVLARGNVVQ